MKYPRSLLICGFLVASCASDTQKHEASRDEELRARLAAQIAKAPEEYIRRPTRRFVSGRKAGEFQPYVDACLERIVQNGNYNYPIEARGKLYGDVRITFWVRKSGSLEKVEIDRSSGYSILDDALVRAIQLSAPFPSFPPSVSEDLDVLVVTQTFSFSRTDKMEESP